MPIPVAIAAGLIAGGATLGGAGINFAQANRNTKRTIKANKELAEYAYDRDLEMWERNNAYNAPAAQMQRLKDANLNPHLVYGNGSVVGNTAGNVPRYNPPRVDYDIPAPVNLEAATMNSISAYQDVTMRQAQIDNIRAQTKQTEVDAAVKALNERYLADTLETRVHREPYITGKISTEAQKGAEELYYLRGTRDTRIKAAELDVIQKGLQNEFQTYKNKWEKYGITGKDAMWIKAAVSMLDALGMDYTWMVKELQQLGLSWVLTEGTR